MKTLGNGSIIFPVLAAMFIMAGSAIKAWAGTSSDTYNDITATIMAPDVVEPNTNFDVNIIGNITGGSGFSVYAYSVYENAVWTYDSNHMVEIYSGTLIEGSGINWGSSITKTFTFNKPVGTYTYTFVFGQRSFGHGYYDVAVDVTVTVKETSPGLCRISWRPPLGARGKAGRTIPLKFTAFDCATGEFYIDPYVRVDVVDQNGSVIASWQSADNPSSGVAIDSTDQQYHVNWDTANDQVGTFLITVQFSTGDILRREIVLE